MIYLTTGSTDARYNLAFEEYFLTHTTAGDYLILWQNDNTVVIGQNQIAEREVDLEYAKEHGITVVRRGTGGGAVYHDLGNLNYSFISDLGDAAGLSMERFTKPVVAALTSLGLDAAASGRNDILVSGRKVSGTAQRVVKGRVLHHGTLLFDSDAAVISSVLSVDASKLEGKGTKSVKSRVGNIREFLIEAGNDMTLGEFWNYLLKFFNAKPGGAVSGDDAEQILKIKKEKYDTWQWNIGKTPRLFVVYA